MLKTKITIYLFYHVILIFYYLKNSIDYKLKFSKININQLNYSKVQVKMSKIRDTF